MSMVILCPSSADTTIVKTAWKVSDKTVTIYFDKADILCLLLHHAYYANEHSDIFLKNITFTWSM